MDQQDKNAINKILNVLERLQHADLDMTIGQLRFLLTVAKMEGSVQSDIGTASGSTIPSTASSHVKILMEPSIAKPNARGLVSVMENPANRRQQFVFLTPKGKKTIAKLISTKGE